MLPKLTPHVRADTGVRCYCLFWWQNAAIRAWFGTMPISPGEDSGAKSPLPCRFFVLNSASTEASHRVRTNSLRPQTTETILEQKVRFVAGSSFKLGKY
jgi:hypothetical protein